MSKRARESGDQSEEEVDLSTSDEDEFAPIPSTSNAKKRFIWNKKSKAKAVLMGTFTCSNCQQKFFNAVKLNVHIALEHGMDIIPEALLKEANPFNVKRVTPLKMFGKQDKPIHHPEIETLFENYQKHKMGNERPAYSVYFVLLIPSRLLKNGNGQDLTKEEVKAWIKASSSKSLVIPCYVGRKTGDWIGISSEHFRNKGSTPSKIYGMKHDPDDPHRVFLAKQYVFDGPDKERNSMNAGILEAWVQAVGINRRNQFAWPEDLLNLETINKKIESPFHALDEGLRRDALDIAGNYDKPIICTVENCDIKEHATPFFKEGIKGVRCDGSHVLEFDAEGKVVKVNWGGCIHIDELIEYDGDGKKME